MLNYLKSYFSATDALPEAILGVKSRKKLYNIYTAAVLSDGIYDDEFHSYLGKSNSDLGWFQPDKFQVTSNQHLFRFAIVEFEDNIFVTIRGSLFQMEDWITNFDATPHSGPAGLLVHKGFNERIAFMPLGEIWRYAKAIKKPLILTGHSKGGGIATLATMKILQIDENARNYVQCITFGAPLVGNREWQNFCKLYPEAFTHFAAKGDPVPIILRKEPYRFCPGGKVYLLTSNSQTSSCTSVSLDTYDTDLQDVSLQLTLNNAIDQLLNVTQHLMGVYLKVIGALARPVSPPSYSDSNSNSPILKSFDIVPVPLINQVDGRIDDNRKVEICLSGSNLGSVVAVHMDYTSLDNGREISVRIPTEDRIIHNANGSIKAKFSIPDKIVRSKVLIDATNGFHIVAKEGSIPFSRVLLIGQVGAGKTLLKDALRDCELGRPTHTIPRSNVKLQPDLNSQVDEGHLIAYEEWLGFVHTSKDEFTKAVTRIFSSPPSVIVVVINGDGPLMTDIDSLGAFNIETSIFGLLGTIQKELRGDIMVLYAITNHAAIPSSKRLATIAGFTNLIKRVDADADRRIFLVNSDPRTQDVFNESGQMTQTITLCPVTGVKELYSEIRKKLDNNNTFSFIERQKRAERVLAIIANWIKLSAGYLWENKLSVLSAAASIGLAWGGIRK